MEELQQFIDNHAALIPVLLLLIIWESIWKLIGMWKAGRNNHLPSFICIALVNSVGIIPIVYILMYRKKNSINVD